MQITSSKIFTEKSENYAQYRPSYNDAAIQKILAPFKSQDIIRIADIGAGTGIGSKLLAEMGAYITAVEPNQRMIEAAETHPRITYQQGSAEEVPLEENAVDIVTSFQAFHWFDFKKSLLEFRRVLKPSGQLTLAWNYWDTSEDPFTAAYVDLINKATLKNNDRIEPYEGFLGKVKRLRMGLLWKYKFLPYFKNVERHNYKLVQKMDLSKLIGLARSQSYILHKGPIWDHLVADITHLENTVQAPELVYDINLFTAMPVK